jgi:CBS domain-containing protein
MFRKQPSAAPVQEALVLRTPDSVTQAVRAMQREHRGCVWVAGDGCRDSKLVGIFTERDMLLLIVDRGKNPAALPVTMREGA